MSDSTPQWKQLPDDDLNASEEIRFATVLNGGVSLAVWMGGVVNEVDAVTRRDGVYGRILTALDSRARVDIIAGTSAGGINGAALACTQVRGQGDGPPFGELLTTWATQGALRRLVTPPGTPEPRSVLRGDDVFLPQLQRAFQNMLPQSTVAQMHGPADRPIQLRLTTTLLHPVLTTSRDSLGTEFVQEQHQGRFTFTRPWAERDKPDHFAPVVSQHEDPPGRRANLPNALGLASRCTASFPVAFEPVYVPIDEDLETSPARPDMKPYANFAVSRWVVDGGVLMNTPLPLVLDDIAAAPAALQTRRVLLLVVPDPTDPAGATNTPDKRDEPLNVRESITGVALSSLAKTIADDFDDLQRHNRSALTRRKARTDLLRSLLEAAEGGRPQNPAGDGCPGPCPALEDSDVDLLARGLFPTYRRIRMRRAATDLAIAAVAAAAPDPDLAPQPEDAVVEGIHRRLWEYLNDRQRPGVPFLPPSIDAGFGEGDWQWGRSPLERLAETVQDLQRRVIWALRPGTASATQLREDRVKLHEWRAALRRSAGAERQTWADISKQSPGNVGALLEQFNVVVPLVPGTAIAEPGSMNPGGRATALALCALGVNAAAEVATSFVPDVVGMSGLEGSDLWRLYALALTFHAIGEMSDENEKLRRLMALDVCLVCLSDVSDVTGEDVVELVQISTSVRHAFTAKPAEERVAGLGLGHFAAFLKQSWRINDWIWGRLDGTDRLITALLDPQRLRRQVLLRASATQDNSEAAAAMEVVRGILGLSDDADLGDCEALAEALAGGIPADSQMAALRRRLVLERGERIVRDHEPALDEAIGIDIDAGADPDSTGRSWRVGYRERRAVGAGDE